MAEDSLSGYDAESLRLAYQASLQRLIEADSKLWQVPGLSLTAQAFLLTIALGSRNDSPGERLAAAFLGLVVAIASIQLMARHRYHSKCDVALLREIEKTKAVVPMVDREKIPGAPVARGISRAHSTDIWQGTMGLFALANLLSGLVLLANLG